MKTFSSRSTRGRRGFSLIEMIAVMTIIAILAALTFPVIGGIRKRATINKAQAELEQVATAIEAYKVRHGFYPPFNTNSTYLNPLYLELAGTTLAGTDYQTLDGSVRIPLASVPTVFGSEVAGFANSTRGSGDDAVPAENFLKGFKPGQHGDVVVGGVTVRLLTCSIEWPRNHAFQPVPASPGLNPWRYNSSTPTNNPATYDLWVDLLIGGKTNRISNWSRQPELK